MTTEGVYWGFKNPKIRGKTELRFMLKRLEKGLATERLIVGVNKNVFNYEVFGFIVG